jgi:hypothetical protein
MRNVVSVELELIVLALYISSVSNALTSFLTIFLSIDIYNYEYTTGLKTT